MVTVVAVIMAGYVEGHENGLIETGFSGAPGDDDCTSCHGDTDPNSGGMQDVTFSVV